MDRMRNMNIYGAEQSDCAGHLKDIGAALVEEPS
jgi:hypothetical protein